MSRIIGPYEKIFERTDHGDVWDTIGHDPREWCYVYSKDPTKLGEWRYRTTPRTRPDNTCLTRRPLPPIPVGRTVGGQGDQVANGKRRKKRKPSVKSKASSKSKAEIKEDNSSHAVISKSSGRRWSIWKKDKGKHSVKSKSSAKQKSKKKNNKHQHSLKSKSSSRRWSIWKSDESKHSAKSKASSKLKTKGNGKDHKGSKKSKFPIRRLSIWKSDKRKRSVKSKAATNHLKVPKGDKHKRSVNPNTSTELLVIGHGKKEEPRKQKTFGKTKGLNNKVGTDTDSNTYDSRKPETRISRLKDRAERALQEAKEICLNLPKRIRDKASALWDRRPKRFKKNKVDIAKDGSVGVTDDDGTEPVLPERGKGDKKGSLRKSKKKKKGEMGKKDKETSKAPIRPYTPRVGITEQMMYGTETTRPVPFVEVAANCGCGCLYMCSLVKVD